MIFADKHPGTVKLREGLFTALLPTSTSNSNNSSKLQRWGYRPPAVHLPHDDEMRTEDHSICCCSAPPCSDKLLLAHLWPVATLPTPIHKQCPSLVTISDGRHTEQMPGRQIPHADTIHKVPLFRNVPLTTQPSLIFSQAFWMKFPSPLIMLIY